jgi:hypothetical protein
MNEPVTISRHALTEREELILLRAEREFEMRRSEQQAPAIVVSYNRTPWIVGGVVAAFLGCMFMVLSFSSYFINIFLTMAKDQAAMSHELAMAAVQSAPTRAANAEGGIVLGAMLALAAIFIIIGLIRGGR